MNETMRMYDALEGLRDTDFVCEVNVASGYPMARAIVVNHPRFLSALAALEGCSKEVFDPTKAILLDRLEKLALCAKVDSRYEHPNDTPVFAMLLLAERVFDDEFMGSFLGLLSEQLKNPWWTKMYIREFENRTGASASPTV
jgi:hypothetical protein